MKQKLIILSLFVAGVIGLPSDVWCQSKLIIGLRSGYAGFKIKDLKYAQWVEEIYGPLYTRIPLKRTASFPGYVSMSGEILLRREKYYFGITGMHSSTGGRLAYSDYSGIASSTTVVHFNEIGLMAAYKIIRVAKIEFYGGVQLMYAFNNMVVTDNITTTSTIENDRNKYYSNAKSAKPFVEILFPVNRFIFKLHGGYEFYVSEQDAHEGSNQFTIGFPPQFHAKIDPTGIRLEAGIGFVLGKAR